MMAPRYWNLGQKPANYYSKKTAFSSYSKRLQILMTHTKTGRLSPRYLLAYKHA